MFRTIFSSKFTTAVISDSANKLYLVPIVHTIGDYFVTELNKTTYVFKIDGSQIKQYIGIRKNVFSLIFFDTSHYKPLNAKSDELEKVLKENSLPKVNSSLAKVFKALGNKEKINKDEDGKVIPFKPHKMEDLIKDLAGLRDNKKKQSKAMKDGYNYDDKFATTVNYLKSLSIDEIVTPLKSVSEYIEGDLVATDPAFMGSIISSYQRTDVEHQLMTNKSSGGKLSMMKILMFAVLIGSVVMVGGLMYSEGMLTGANPLEKVFPSFKTSNAPIDLSNNDEVMERYPTGQSLKAAVDSGKVDYNKLSPQVQAMVDES